MRNFLTLASGLILGLISAVLFLRAGVPPALVALVLWTVGGTIGISLMQFAFLNRSIQASTQAAVAKPLRAFLLGVLVLLVPIFAASCLKLLGADGLATLSVILFFGGLILLIWPANIAYLVGRRLLPEAPETRQVTAGSFVTSTALLVPILGWIWIFYLATLTTGGFCLRGRYA